MTADLGGENTQWRPRDRMISKVTSVLAKNNNGCRVNGNRTQDQSARKVNVDFRMQR
jgi:hypothetical protein